MIESKILVVDDSEAIVDTLCDTLERLGLPKDMIFRADSGDAALKIFKQQQPPVVFMDVDLGGQAGDKIAGQMLKLQPNTKIIVMSGFDRNDARVRNLISAGAYEFMPKPLRLGKLQELLELMDSEAKGLRRVS